MMKLFNLYKPFLKSRNFHVCLRELFPTPIKMPSLSPTMDEGVIVEWHLKEGENITAGDAICDIQTDKAVVSMEMEEDGILAKIIKPVGTGNIKVGELIAVFADSSEDWQNITIPDSWLGDLGNIEIKTLNESENISLSSETVTTPIPFMGKIGPAARLLLEQYKIDLSAVKQFTGPNNIPLKEDILKHISDNNLQPVKSQKVSEIEVKKSPINTTKSTGQTPSVNDYVDIELTSMRKTIAKRLAHSKSTIPHAYITKGYCMSQILSSRNHYNVFHQCRVSFNDYVIKAVALALQRSPLLNASFIGENSISYNKNVDVSVAVATPSGLITPIIFGADKLLLHEINDQVRELAGRAKINKLKPEEFTGGTFTISNLGMFGVKEFTAIINPPQGAILAVGGFSTEFAGTLTAEGKAKPLEVAYFTLSYNSGFIDAAQASEFMELLGAFFQDPQLLEEMPNYVAQFANDEP